MKQRPKLNDKSNYVVKIITCFMIMLFGPIKFHKTELFYRDHLPAINVRVPAIFCSPATKKMLHYLSAATADTQICKFETFTRFW